VREENKLSPDRYRNQLLSKMTPDTLSLLEPHLLSVPLKSLQRLQRRTQAIDFVYFPESGLLSLLALEGARHIEVGLIGYDGMSGLPLILGNDSSPHEYVVQVSGTAHRLPATVLRTALQSSVSLREVLANYAHSMMIQMAYAALAIGQAKLEERLARWLLMSQDRVGDELPLTHDNLSFSLGVRRAGVTNALQRLQSARLIRASRGRVFITDRAGLKEIARGLYGMSEGEHHRLTGCSVPQAQGLREGGSA
jgi:CRP-like cAMP-binding protein